MTDPKDIGIKLREYMRQQGISTKKIADDLYVSDVTVRNWKSGRTSLSLQRAEQLAKLLHIKVDDLLDNTIS